MIIHSNSDTRAGGLNEAGNVSGESKLAEAVGGVALSIIGFTAAVALLLLFVGVIPGYFPTSLPHYGERLVLGTLLGLSVGSIPAVLGVFGSSLAWKGISDLNKGRSIATNAELSPEAKAYPGYDKL